MNSEFDRQLNNLLVKGYPEAAGISSAEFAKQISPLKEKLPKHPIVEPDLVTGRLPFVIVIKSQLVDSEVAMSLVVRAGKPGLTKLYPLAPHDFQTIEDVAIPNSQAYLLLAIDRGKATLNIRPNDAFTAIKSQGSTPLTIDEGIAILTHFPDFLMKNNCFSLLASRHTGDQRVPAIWINAQKNPNLGWCWAGNPHTWLGSASAEKRQGI